MRLSRIVFVAAAFNLAAITGVNADVKVITSIKPVHSLVSAVMEGVSKPGLIIEGAASPHSYSLKPSQAKELQNADIVFWMGDDLETFLKKPIKAVAKNAAAIKLSNSHGIKKLKFREGGAFDAHDDHDDHGHDKHAKKDDHDDHDHDKHAKKDDHDDHGHGEFDPHVWLDPVNAKAIVHEIEEVLAKSDPNNASKYEKNAERLMRELDALVTEVRADLEPVHEKGFIVFHDAYQYFERRFDMSAVGSITVSPEVLPGAERIKELQDKVRNLSATCVFSEPQFEPKIVKTIIENTNAKTGVLDPLGASIKSGPDMYFTLIRDMANSLKACLS